MTPEEQVRFEKMEDLLSDIHKALKGDGMMKEQGLVEMVLALRKEVDLLKDQLRTIRNIFKGLAIGFGVAAFLFGIVSGKAFVTFIKSLF